jgi:hypothetical protein
MPSDYGKASAHGRGRGWAGFHRRLGLSTSFSPNELPQMRKPSLETARRRAQALHALQPQLFCATAEFEDSSQSLIRQ